MELSKADKRLCRELIDTGIERECRQFVEQVRKIALEPIPPELINEPYSEINGIACERVWHKRYIKLYNATERFNRHIAHRYDHVTASSCLECVAGLYTDNWLTDEEIARLSDESQDYINKSVSLYSNP